MNQGLQSKNQCFGGMKRLLPRSVLDLLSAGNSWRNNNGVRLSLYGWEQPPTSNRH
jgi:hypothetical protein